MDEEQIRRDAEEAERELMEKGMPEEKHHHPRTRKILTLILGIFLLTTFIVAMVSGGWMSHIIAGMIDSSKMKGNTIRIIEGIEIRFEEEPLTRLYEIYDDNRGVEFKVCLKGGREGKVYNVQEIVEPVMHEQTATSVRAEPCPTNTLVSMHSHPIKHCLPSDVDIINFVQFKKRNPDALMAVMCEEDRFTFYK